MNSVLAVDLGGTKTALALVDEEGGIHEHRCVPATRSLADTVSQIVDSVAGASAVGIIVPGIYSVRTGRAWCPNLWGTDEVPLLDALRKKLQLPIVIDSDRSGYVLGEAWLGVARGLSDVVFVAVGTGIGVGILAGGKVIHGAHGIAGAAGWCALTPEWKNVYHQAGCWESEAAGPAVARLGNAPDAQSVVDAARNGDADAQGILNHASRYTGMGVANLISVLNPEMVVLGGGLMQGAGDLMIENIRAGVAQWGQPIASRLCAIELTKLGENAGLLGAARLALLKA